MCKLIELFQAFMITPMAKKLHPFPSLSLPKIEPVNGKNYPAEVGPFSI